jgi:hypothetical protein
VTSKARGIFNVKWSEMQAAASKRRVCHLRAREYEEDRQIRRQMRQGREMLKGRPI